MPSESIEEKTSVKKLKFLYVSNTGSQPAEECISYCENSSGRLDFEYEQISGS